MSARVAALCDIHGNLPALEAVLLDVRQAGVDEIVVGGDVIPGPMPVETIEHLQSIDLPVHYIYGNGEREALAQRAGIESSAIPEKYRGVMRWVAKQLRPKDELLLKSWPATLHVSVDGLGDVLFCHATPRSDSEIFIEQTPEDRLMPIFERQNAALVVCGHTHIQFDRMIGRTRVVNAGSVGMPFGEPGAYWLLLGPKIELRHTMYDLADAAERIRATRYPQADEFAENNVLCPPSAEQIRELYARVEIKGQ
jgi:predicted phosphodiesterase